MRNLSRTTGKEKQITRFKSRCRVILFAALARNETRASKAVANAADYLDLALADFVNICNVPTIVLDGLYSKLFEYLKGPLLLKLSKRVLSSKWAKINVLKSISTSNSSHSGQHGGA